MYMREWGYIKQEIEIYPANLLFVCLIDVKYNEVHIVTNTSRL